MLEGRHFDDDIMAYGFHDSAPRLQIKEGRTYGVPYRALRVAGLDNLLAAGMMITSDHDAHMSTRNTVCCMGQGQATGTAAALCAERELGSRDLRMTTLRDDGLSKAHAGMTTLDEVYRVTQDSVTEKTKASERASS